jgi:hypothetical protein
VGVGVGVGIGLGVEEDWVVAETSIDGFPSPAEFIAVIL